MIVKLKRRSGAKKKEGSPQMAPMRLVRRRPPPSTPMSGPMAGPMAGPMSSQGPAVGPA